MTGRILAGVVVIFMDNGCWWIQLSNLSEPIATTWLKDCNF